MTKQQASCYLNRYPDLRKAYGYTSTSWIKAQVHWHTFGKAEGRNFECETKPFKCADEGGSCTCPNGFLHYGMRYQTWHNLFHKEARFQESMQWMSIFREIPLPGGKIECSNKILGGDPLRGKSKVCWCEPYEKLPPFFVSIEGNAK